jgi:large subunit ribosomal protein L22
MKASLKNYRQSPRKVRLVADLVRGKSVDQALVELRFLPKRASEVMTKLLSSAKANAENNFKVDGKDLMVKEISVDQGVTLKRYRPRARGVAKRINKRTSNITLSLGVKN